MKYLVFYESGNDVAAKAPRHGPAHVDHYRKFQAQGTLLLIGPYSDQSGALAVFTTREAAEAFARNDPFVVNGVVANWYIREWREVIVPE